MRYYLTGFMGSGKTYWGRRLAERLNCPFIDLDALIEASEEQTVADIFTSRGEGFFRTREAEGLRSTAAWPEAVIATGGGPPCFHNNMTWMNAHGRTIFLDTPVAILAQRLKNGRAPRPLIQNLDEADLLDFIQNKLQEREPFYRQAQIVLPTEGRESDFLEQLVAAANQ